MIVVDATAALIFSASVMWCAYALACRSFADAPWSTRVSASAVILVWLLNVVFLLMSVPRLFTRPFALVLWCVFAATADRWAGPVARRTIRKDLATVRGWWLTLTSPVRILAGVGLVVVVARLGHGLLAPPLTWDALTYHLYKPVAWIQAQGWTSTTGPDASGYYQWFPPYGDVIWGWWLLATRGDTLMAGVAAGTWLMVLVGCYGAARALGATVQRATLAAFAVAFTPAVLVFMAAPHVDNLVLALFCAGALFLARAFERHDMRDGVLAAAAFGILAGVKSSALPVCAIGVLGALVATRRSPDAAIGVLAAASPALVPPLFAWHATGSPFYPLTLRIGSRVVFPGNPELDWLLRGEWLSPEFVEMARAQSMARTFLPWVRFEGDFMNLGLGVVLLVVGAAGGLWALRSAKEKKIMVAFYLVAALITIASVAGTHVAALRLFWWPVLGRLVTVSVAASAVIAAQWPSAIVTRLFFVSAAVSLASSWPGGLTRVDLHAGTAAAGLFLVVVLGWWLASRVIQQRLVVATAAAVLMLTALMIVRDRYRASYYAAAEHGQAYDVHALDPLWVASWPLWERFHASDPVTIAVSAGWGGLGHNWYQYPLAGRHLQNRLLYVPTSLDGAIFDYALLPAHAPETSCDQWVARLRAAQADYLVLLPPLPAEAEWAEALPDVFQPDVDLGEEKAKSYRIMKSPPSAAPPCSSNLTGR